MVNKYEIMATHWQKLLEERFGAAAMCVGIDVGAISSVEITASGGEVNNLVGRLLGETFANHPPSTRATLAAMGRG